MRFSIHSAAISKRVSSILSFDYCFIVDIGSDKLIFIADTGQNPEKTGVTGGGTQAVRKTMKKANNSDSALGYNTSTSFYRNRFTITHISLRKNFFTKWQSWKSRLNI